MALVSSSFVRVERCCHQFCSTCPSTWVANVKSPLERRWPSYDHNMLGSASSLIWASDSQCLAAAPVFLLRNKFDTKIRSKHYSAAINQLWPFPLGYSLRLFSDKIVVRKFIPVATKVPSTQTLRWKFWDDCRRNMLTLLLRYFYYRQYISDLCLYHGSNIKIHMFAAL